MKVCLINHSDSKGGASVVTMRLTEALRAAGHDARLLVVDRTTDRPFVGAVGGSRLPFYAEHLRIFAGNGFNREDLFKASIATDGHALSRHPWVREADAVILNWVNQGMVSLEEIRKIGRMGKRILWTMHDMWNATGICHHTGDCERFRNEPPCGFCPLLHGRAGEGDLSRRTALRKMALYADVPITFVAVSRWLAERCRQSTVMAGQRIEVIPNAFPAQEYALPPKYSRADLGLPDGPLIVMGAARLDDPVKGFELAVDALNRVGEGATAVFFGNLRNPALLDGLKMPHLWLGPIADPERVRSLYHHADVVLSSSLFETLPGTLIEGLAAGAFPVSFDRGGQADIIDHLHTGYLAPVGDTAALAEGIRYALNHPADREALRASVADRFSAPTIAQAYLSLLAGE